MRNLMRLMVVAAAVLIVFFIFDSPVQENEVLEGPEKVDPLPAEAPQKAPFSVDRPAEGVSTYIGRPSEEWTEAYGEPSYIEPSGFGYDWWVYDQSLAHFLMVGIKDDQVVQVYAAGTATNPAPFQIGQTLDDLYRFTIVDSEISVPFEDNMYTFHLTGEDMQTRLLINFTEVYAQLYIDAEDKRLEAVRYTDAETLIRHQPYDMLYTGELLPVQESSSLFQQEVDAANARQIMSLSNVYRVRHEQRPLSEYPALHLVAQEKSVETVRQSLPSAEPAESISLAERLTNADIAFNHAAENTATKYYDAAEVVHGWLNSTDHRSTLLSETFTYTGTGAYGKYYTQIYLDRDSELTPQDQNVNAAEEQ